VDELDSAESVVRFYYDHDPNCRNGPVQMAGSFRALDCGAEGRVVREVGRKRGGILPPLSVGILGSLVHLTVQGPRWELTI